MNLKLFGSFRYEYFVLLFALLSCMNDIPGEPKKRVQEYITAVQKGDFETIYRLHRVTAQQKKYLEQTEGGDLKELMKQNYERNKASYESVKPSFMDNIQWAEKYFFPPSCSPSVGEPQKPAPATKDDPGYADYEKALTTMVPVSVTYNSEKDAPQLSGRKLKFAKYICILGKIREGSNVRIYSHDDQWFFNGCIPDSNSVRFF